MANPPIDLGAYLKEKKSPFAEHLPDLIASANRHRVDPRFIIALSGAESSFGKISKGHNAWGIGPHERYGSWQEGFERAAKLIRTFYVNEGRKSVPLIGQKWAPIGVSNDPTNLNSNWVRNVKTIYAALGGDPNDVTKGWRKMSAPQAVAKLPSQQPVVVAPPPPTDQLPSQLGVMERQAFEGLTRIAQGGDPRHSLKQLADAAMQEATAAAAARVTVRDTEPKVDSTPSPEDSGKPGQVKPSTKLKPGGGWGGSYSIAKSLADIGISEGLTAISEKRATKNTKSGNVSDHFEGNPTAYAFDLSDGDEPTPAMDASAVKIAAKLGVKYDGKSPLVLTVRMNGYRIQVLYRTDVGGNHYNHLHLGVRKL